MKRKSKKRKNSIPRVSESNAMGASTGFNRSDLVWAKAYPYTWWPGRIERIQNSSCLVSFYGCEKTAWFRVHKVCAFAENYARMVRLIGVKLRREIGLALEELNRRMAMDLVCSCRSFVVGGEGSLGRGGFDVVGMLDYVRDKAVVGWVGDEETVRFFQVSHQVSAFRQQVLICGNGEVDEGFCPEELLDVVTGLGVSWWNGGADFVDSLAGARALSQIIAYRQFVSICSNWLCWNNGGDVSVSGSDSDSDESADLFISDESEGTINKTLWLSLCFSNWLCWNNGGDVSVSGSYSDSDESADLFISDESEGTVINARKWFG